MPYLETFLSEEQIQTRIAEMGAEISRDYGDQEIVLVAILKGSIPFLADLSRKLGENVVIDTMRVSSYGDAMESSGIVKIVTDLEIGIEGKHVLLIEDIVDTGATLSYLLELLATRRPASVKVASLLSKPEARKTDVPIAYLGFEIPNAFVVGYGLDYAERYRNLPFIAIYRES